jgi:hypothetical protein
MHLMELIAGLVFVLGCLLSDLICILEPIGSTKNVRITGGGQPRDLITKTFSLRMLSQRQTQLYGASFMNGNMI